MQFSSSLYRFPEAITSSICNSGDREVGVEDVPFSVKEIEDYRCRNRTLPWIPTR